MKHKPSFRRRVIAFLSRLVPAGITKKILEHYEYDQDLTLRHDMLCLRQDYSSPVTVARDIDTSLLGKKRVLPGIDVDLEGIRWLGGEISRHAAEFPWKSAEGDQPEVPWDIMFPTVDSMVLYTMIRHFKPKRYIEVGCGYSSRVSTAALEKNATEGPAPAVTYIEPYPDGRLTGVKLAGIMLEDRIQEIPLEKFEELEAGDMLFIDTSHIMKCQSDVEWELLHILPSLRAGVIVHVHDIFTPYEQPESWLENSYAPGLYNEQYAFEALLSGGKKFTCLFPNHLACREMSGDLSHWFGTVPDASRSFWIQVN